MTAAAPLAIPAFVHSYAWVSVASSVHGLFAGVLGCVDEFSTGYVFEIPLLDEA